MQDKLENLDDDFAAIQRIVKRTGSSKNREDDEAVESAKKQAAGSKFAKSLKEFVDKPQKKKKFSELKSSKITGNEVYEGQKDKLREKKVARKEQEKKIKQNALEGVEKMGD